MMSLRRQSSLAAPSPTTPRPATIKTSASIHLHCHDDDSESGLSSTCQTPGSLHSATSSSRNSTPSATRRSSQHSRDASPVLLHAPSSVLFGLEATEKQIQGVMKAHEEVQGSMKELSAAMVVQQVHRAGDAQAKMTDMAAQAAALRRQLEALQAAKELLHSQTNRVRMSSMHASSSDLATNLGLYEKHWAADETVCVVPLPPKEVIPASEPAKPAAKHMREYCQLKGMLATFAWRLTKFIPALAVPSAAVWYANKVMSVVQKLTGQHTISKLPIIDKQTAIFVTSCYRAQAAKQLSPVSTMNPLVTRSSLAATCRLLFPYLDSCGHMYKTVKMELKDLPRYMHTLGLQAGLGDSSMLKPRAVRVMQQECHHKTGRMQYLVIADMGPTPITTDAANLYTRPDYIKHTSIMTSSTQTKSVLSVVGGMAQAIVDLHAKGVVHGDVHPGCFAVYFGETASDMAVKMHDIDHATVLSQSVLEGVHGRQASLTLGQLPAENVYSVGYCNSMFAPPEAKMNSTDSAMGKPHMSADVYALAQTCKLMIGLSDIECALHSSNPKTVLSMFGAKVNALSNMSTGAYKPVSTNVAPALVKLYQWIDKTLCCEVPSCRLGADDLVIKVNQLTDFFTAMDASQA